MGSGAQMASYFPAQKCRSEIRVARDENGGQMRQAAVDKRRPGSQHFGTRGLASGLG